jgi:hypothetical protein
VRCRPGTVPVCGGPGSAVHHERTLAQGTNFDGFHALVLHRIRDTPLQLVIHYKGNYCSISEIMLDFTGSVVMFRPSRSTLPGAFS